MYNSDIIKYFSVIGAGLLIISLFVFHGLFGDVQFLTMLIAISQIQLPPNSSSALIILFLPHEFELYATLVSFSGIGLLIFVAGYLSLRDFDWNEPWMRYSLVSLIIGIIMIAIGLGIIHFKRMLLPLYMLMTIALGNWGWLSYISAPFNILDAMIAVCVGIGFAISTIAWIYRYPPY